jgi:hypothetical protein
MAAQALGVGAGALLCAGPQALVCGGVAAALITAGMVGAWWMSSSSVENADEQAGTQLDSGTAAATCATGNCPPPPECKDLNDKAKSKRDEIRKRIQELREDKRDLFKNHYYKSQAHPTYGSWIGHIEQLEGWQQGLRNILDKARNKNCPSAGDDVNKTATEPAPTQPGPKP